MIKYLKIDNYFLGVKNDKPERFISEINNYEWFVRPRLADGELRINVPLMRKTAKGFDLYFIYYGTTIKDLDTLTYQISCDVLNKMGYDYDNIYLVYLNGEYVNEGSLDVDKLFIITDEYKHQKLSKIISKLNVDYETVIKQMSTSSIKDYNPKKRKPCRLTGICDYYDRCFPNEAKLEDDSILSLVSSAKKNDMYDEGIRCLKDVDINRLEGNRVQYAQIMASKNNGLFFDRYALKDFLNDLNEYPISFIDFEWDRYLVPIYRGMKPMDVVCFEFALYILDENGHLEHRTFVGTQDCRREFVEGLIQYLPKTGPILAYNALGAECLRLKELMDVFPEYKDELENMNSRFIDLATPFIEGIVYDTRMQGNYTLKRLVNICSEYDYSDLNIDDGMAAVYNWRDIGKGSNDKEIIENLKEYCSLDAYGLYLVYCWLTKLLV